MLEYGRADSIGRRIGRRVPRVGRWAVLAAGLFALAILWLVRDHEVWAVARVIPRDSSARTALAMPADGSRLAAPVENGVDVWDLSTLERVATIRTAARVRGVEFSADGRRLLVEPDDYTFRAYDAASGKELATIERPKEARAAFSPDARRVLMWTGPTAALWDAESGKRVALLLGPGGVRASGRATRGWFSFDGAYAAIEDSDRADVVAVRSEDGGPAPREAAARDFYPEAVSADRRRVATRQVQGSFKVADADGGHGVAITAAGAWWIILSADGRIAATAGSGAIELWDATTGRRLASMFPPRRFMPSSDVFRLLRGGDRLLVATPEEASVWRWSATPGVGFARVLKAPCEGGWSRESAVASPDESCVATFDTRKGVPRADAWDTADGRWLGGTALPGLPEDARFARDGTLLVSRHAEVYAYRPRRAVGAWGYAALPATWAVAVSGAAAAFLVGRDVRRWYRPAVARR